jgi:hypothetical protein
MLIGSLATDGVVAQPALQHGSITTELVVGFRAITRAPSFGRTSAFHPKQTLGELRYGPKQKLSCDYDSFFFRCCARRESMFKASTSTENPIAA